MTYSKDNIENLRVKRGGMAEYLIEWVGYDVIGIRHIASGRINDFSLHTALRYLNRGKWTVMGEGKHERVKVLETYEIY